MGSWIIFETWNLASLYTSPARQGIACVKLGEVKRYHMFILWCTHQNVYLAWYIKYTDIGPKSTGMKLVFDNFELVLICLYTWFWHAMDRYDLWFPNLRNFGNTGFPLPQGLSHSSLARAGCPPQHFTVFDTWRKAAVKIRQLCQEIDEDKLRSSKVYCRRGDGRIWWLAFCFLCVQNRFLREVLSNTKGMGISPMIASGCENLQAKRFDLRHLPLYLQFPKKTSQIFIDSHVKVWKVWMDLPENSELNCLFRFHAHDFSRQQAGFPHTLNDGTDLYVCTCIEE